MQQSLGIMVDFTSIMDNQQENQEHEYPKLGIGAGRRSKPLTIEQKDMKISDELVAVN